MLRFATFAALLAVACAGYGYGGYGSGYGSGAYLMPVYGGSYGGYGGSYGGGVGNYITGAVQSSRSLSYYDVPSSYGSASPVTIDLPSSVQPLNFNMRTRSSPINIQTSHESSPGSYQETSSVDEPHVRVHNVHRPIIQRLNEVIQPYRQIRQQVNPVQENVQTVVARGQQQQAYGGGYGGSSLYGSGYGNQGGYGGQTSSYYKK